MFTQEPVSEAREREREGEGESANLRLRGGKSEAVQDREVNRYDGKVTKAKD